MTRETALSLLKQYGEYLRASCAGTDDAVMKEIDLRFPATGDEAKAMRWLGFIQGCCYADRVFTLHELKEHSRTGVVTWPEGLIEDRQ